MTIFRTEHSKNYTVVNNTIITDKRLSWRAKGVWLYAFSRPDDWTFHINDIINQSTEGRDAVRKALKELENCGYLHKSQKRNEKNEWDSAEYVFYETPRELKESLPHPENPSTGNPSTEKRPLLSTDSTNQNTSYSLPKEKNKAAPSAEASALSNFLHDKIKAWKPNFKQPNFMKWAESFDLLIKKDKRSVQEIEKVIVFAHQHGFWKTVTLSAKSLRNNFDSIQAQMTEIQEKPTKKVTIKEICKSQFKDGHIYSDATCYLNEDGIAFMRGMRHEEVKFKFANREAVQKLCSSFGIPFNAEGV